MLRSGWAQRKHSNHSAVTFFLFALSGSIKGLEWQIESIHSDRDPIGADFGRKKECSTI